MKLDKVMEMIRRRKVTGEKIENIDIEIDPEAREKWNPHPEVMHIDLAAATLCIFDEPFYAGDKPPMKVWIREKNTCLLENYGPDCPKDYWKYSGCNALCETLRHFKIHPNDISGT